MKDAIMNILEKSDRSLPQKLGHVLSRLNVAMRAENWHTLSEDGLNPTQGQVLLLLEHRSVPLRLSEIAAELAVTAPTVSDSVSSLVEKGLVKKRRAADDQRALAVTLTAQGKKLVRRLDNSNDAVVSAITHLNPTDQTQLYRTLLQILRELQQLGRIPVARMCVTCRYFRPNHHDDPTRPHHCALVDAAFGDQTIRSDCPDHEEADVTLAEQNWKTFTS